MNGSEEMKTAKGKISQSYDFELQRQRGKKNLQLHE
jgi:hypothetical protein